MSIPGVIYKNFLIYFTGGDGDVEIASEKFLKAILQV